MQSASQKRKEGGINNTEKPLLELYTAASLSIATY